MPQEEEKSDDEPSGEPIEFSYSNKYDSTANEENTIAKVMASEYRNRRFNSIYLVCSDITAKSMPWVFKKLQGSRIESLSI